MSAAAVDVLASAMHVLEMRERTGQSAESWLDNLEGLSQAELEASLTIALFAARQVEVPVFAEGIGVPAVAAT